MALASADFVHAAAFAGLALGAVFSFDGLAPYQIAIKVEGQRSEDWLLILGGGTAGVYPSPWYGLMEDVRGATVYLAGAPLRVEPTGHHINQAEGQAVLPGYLLRRKRQRFGVFIGDALCIDLTTGRRFRGDVRHFEAYDQWALAYRNSANGERLFQYPAPENVRL